jgi:hypothetical protein
LKRAEIARISYPGELAMASVFQGPAHGYSSQRRAEPRSRLRHG